MAFMAALGQGAGAAVAGGLLGGLFGGGKPKKSFAERMFEQAIKEAMKTNLVDLDEQQVAAQRANTQKDSMDTLSAYDAQSASQGSDPGQFDSRKEIQKSLIAYRGARDTAGLEAGLNASRPFRKLYLSTGGGSIGDLGRLSQGTQQYNDAKQANSFGSIMELVGELMKNKPIKPQFGAGGGGNSFANGTNWGQGRGP